MVKIISILVSMMIMCSCINAQTLIATETWASNRINEAETRVAVEIAAHAGRTDNPHSVTAAQVGAATPAQVTSIIAAATNALAPPDVSGLVPYTGAAGDVDLGGNALAAGRVAVAGGGKIYSQSTMFTVQLGGSYEGHYAKFTVVNQYGNYWGVGHWETTYGFGLRYPADNTFCVTFPSSGSDAVLFEIRPDGGRFTLEWTFLNGYIPGTVSDDGNGVSTAATDYLAEGIATPAGTLSFPKGSGTLALEQSLGPFLRKDVPQTVSEPDWGMQVLREAFGTTYALVFDALGISLQESPAGKLVNFSTAGVRVWPDGGAAASYPWPSGPASQIATLADIAGAVKSATVTAIWTGTQTQYDAIPSPSPDTLYIIVEDTP